MKTINEFIKEALEEDEINGFCILKPEFLDHEDDWFNMLKNDGWNIVNKVKRTLSHDEAEELYKKEQYQKALDLLQRLYPGSNAGLQKTLLFYKAYAYAKLKQKEKAESQVREIAELKDSAFDASKYCQAIESLLVAMD